MVYDAVIVGSGVAGALIAHRLLDKGMKVAMLEAGPEPESRKTMLDRYHGAALKVPSSATDDHREVPRPDVTQPNGYYSQKGPSIFKSGYERLVGGSTWHWLGTCMRMMPEDMMLRSRYVRGVDWPISYQDLEPYYVKAEHFLDVAGDSSYVLGSPRSVPYPVENAPVSYLDKVVRKRLADKKIFGQAYQVSTNPQARNPNRCLGSNSCVPLCPVGAKYEAYNHIKKAQLKGLHLYTKAVARRVLCSSSSTISSIEYVDWTRKASQMQGRLFVLAAGGIETPRLLLNSSCEKMPSGASNSSLAVGRYLMDHPVQLSWALMPVDVWPFRGPLSTSGIENFRMGSMRRAFAASRIEIHNDGWSWADGAPLTNARNFIRKGLSGDALKQAMREHCLKQISLASLMEQLPQWNNKVALSKEHKDSLGIPRPEIEYHFSKYEENGFKEAKISRETVLNDLGCHSIISGTDVFGAGHIMGTTRMGNDAKSAVVNSWGQSFDHPNLYIAGSSLFPTGGTSNPTLTILALAERTSAHMVKAV